MRRSKLYKIADNSTVDVMQYFLSKFGVPESNSQMAIYLSNKYDKNKEVHIKLAHKKCHVRYVNLESDQKSALVEFNVKSNGLRSFLKMLRDCGYLAGTIGEAYSLVYKREGEIVIEIVVDTFIGDIVTVYYNQDDDFLAEQVSGLISLDKVIEIERPEINKLINDANLIKYEIVSEHGTINNKIFHFCRSNAIDITEHTETLKDQIDSFSNDYERYEEIFHQLFDKELLGNTSVENYKFYEPVSIVVSCFQSESTLLKTIASIQSQKLPNDLLKQTEIILVDDGSTTRVEDVLKDYPGEIITELKIVRLAKNSGLSHARNIGLNLAKNEIIVFLDSDIIVSNNYLLEISIRNQLIPNAIFVSFKQNMDKDDVYISLDNAVAGLPSPKNPDDIRISKTIKEGSPALVPLNRDTDTEILSETNYFKDFGYGRKIGIFDLASMVIGHNMSSRKKSISKAGGFSQEFKGWGIEDTYFGAKLIATRNFVIPVLSCGVYHIDHPPRSGSEDQKRIELEQNLEKLRKILDRPFDF